MQDYSGKDTIFLFLLSILSIINTIAKITMLIIVEVFSGMIIPIAAQPIMILDTILIFPTFIFDLKLSYILSFMKRFIVMDGIRNRNTSKYTDRYLNLRKWVSHGKDFS